MRHIITLVVATCSLLLTTPGCTPAQSNEATERATLARALAGAWLPLESGLVLGSTQGTPISAKYELEDGVLQLSVYTLKPNSSSADGFMKVLVDYSAGMIARVEALDDDDDDDLSAVQTQQAAMAKAKRSLAAVTADAVNANPGYRAVSAIPSLHGDDTVVEVKLLRGDDWKVLSVPLN
jgi:hypothetical protein